jgi:hypothetical protein
MQQQMLGLVAKVKATERTLHGDELSLVIVQADMTTKPQPYSGTGAGTQHDRP